MANIFHMAMENKTIFCGDKIRKPWRLFAAIVGRTLINTFFIFMGIFILILVLTMIVGLFTPFYRLDFDNPVFEQFAFLVLLIVTYPAAYHAAKYAIDRCTISKGMALRCMIFALCFSSIMNAYLAVADEGNRELFLISPVVYTGGIFLSAIITIYYARLLLVKKYSSVAGTNK